jgi:hypothetical protein
MGIDRAGVLCIGSTKNLKSRLKNLKRYVINALRVARGKVTTIKEYKHTLALSLLYMGLAKKISENELLVCYKIFSDEKEARIQEALALYEYTKRYGEPPPLNLNIARHRLLILDVGMVDKSIITERLDFELASILGLDKTVTYDD